MLALHAARACIARRWFTSIRLAGCVLVAPSSWMVGGDNDGRGPDHCAGMAMDTARRTRRMFGVRVLLVVTFIGGCLGYRKARSADVNFSINAAQSVHSISPYI